MVDDWLAAPATHDRPPLPQPLVRPRQTAERIGHERQPHQRRPPGRHRPRSGHLGVHLRPGHVPLRGLEDRPPELNRARGGQAAAMRPAGRRCGCRRGPARRGPCPRPGAAPGWWWGGWCRPGWPGRTGRGGSSRRPRRCRSARRRPAAGGTPASPPGSRAARPPGRSSCRLRSASTDTRKRSTRGSRARSASKSPRVIMSVSPACSAEMMAERRDPAVTSTPSPNTAALAEHVDGDAVPEDRGAAGDEDPPRHDVQRVAGVALVEHDLVAGEPPAHGRSQQGGALLVAERGEQVDGHWQPRRSRRPSPAHSRRRVAAARPAPPRARAPAS